MAKILVYGSLNIDYVYQVPHFVAPGETLLSLSRQVFAGGKGLNQAVALAQAQGDVYFAGSINKYDGQLLIETLKAKNVNIDLICQREDEPSGHTFIQIDAQGQNCILLFGGTNRSNRKEELDRALEQFSAGDFLVLQNETNDVDYIVKKAHAKGMEVCLNVSPFDEAINNIPLELCAYLIVNELEGAALVGMIDKEDPYTIIKALRNKYQQSNILLTLGSRGSILALREKESKQYQVQEPISCRAFKVKAIDTTAAGDTFLGYFICQMANNIEPTIALQNATAASALAVMAHGAAPSIPKLEQVLDFVKEHESTLGTV